jgi:protein phosphatase
LKGKEADKHGCLRELTALLRLGYDLDAARHPEGRKVVFLGDLVDRGPDVPGVLRLVMRLVAGGAALCLPGNHEVKLLPTLRGKLRRVHECVFGVLALESEPIDPEL